MPEAGKPLSIEDAHEIFEAIRTRHRNFPDEPMGMTAVLVLLNIGDRYASVVCMHEPCSWTGIKKDIPKGEGIPTCPNGHVLMQSAGLVIGWLPVKTGE